MCGFVGVQIGNYFGGELISRIEVELRVRSLRMERLQVIKRSQESSDGTSTQYWISVVSSVFSSIGTYFSSFLISQN